MIGIDHIEKACGRVVPETLAKGCRRGAAQGAPTLRDAAPGVERIDPERLYLDWLADAGRDHPIADSCIHPRQLHTGFARGQQPVIVTVDAVAGATRVAFENRCHRELELRAIVLRQHGARVGMRQELPRDDDVPQ